MKTASFVWISLVALVCAGCGGAGSKVSGSGSANLTPSSRAVRLAVDGTELFALSFPDGPAFAKGGTFGVSPTGQLVHAATGAPLLGWSAEATPSESTPAGPLSVPIDHLDAAQPTSLVRLDGILEAGAWEGDKVRAPVRVYDAHGDAHDLTFVFEHFKWEEGSSPAAPQGSRSSWDWIVYEGDDSYGFVLGSSSSPGNTKLYFDDRGAPVFPVGAGSDQNPQNLVFAPTETSPSWSIEADFADIEQLKTASQVVVTTQDGFPVGTLQGYDIQGDGTILGLFTNGMAKPLGRLALARFDHPQSLKAMASGLARPTSLSGPAHLGAPQTDGRGSVVVRQDGA